MKGMYDDINPQSVAKASEVLPRIELPQPGNDPIIVALNEEPYVVEIPNASEGKPSEMIVGKVFQLSPERREGSMVFPKSLRFNIAKAIAQTGKDYKKVKLQGKTFKVWSIMDGSQKYYQAELWSQETLVKEDNDET